MADVIHEFSSDDNITYSELTAGHTLATTGSNETAVIRDISFEIPGGRPIDMQIDGITVARASGSCNIGGTLLMKSSQTLKAVPAEDAVWVGVKANYGTQNTLNGRYYRKNDLSSSSDYFKIPGTGENDRIVFNTVTEQNEITTSQQSMTALTNGGGLGTGNYITVWQADSMFNKPEGDMYYTELFYNAKVNNGYNHLKYYDKSANTVTELVNGDSNYKNWSNGYTNKYLMRRDSNNTMQYFQPFDTSTNTLGSQTYLTRSDNGGSSYIYYYPEQHNFSPLDDYCIGRTSPTNSSDCYLTLIKLVGTNAGRMCLWESSGSVSDNKPMRNYSTGSSSHTYCQLVKNTAGIYYVLWPYYRSNSWSSNGSGYGLQVFELGTASAMEAYFTSGATYQNPSGLQHICTWPGAKSSPSSGEIDYRGFRLNDNASNQYHWGTGFCPLKKLTATDSSASHWMYMNNEYGYLLDIDNVSGDSHSWIKQVYFKEGTNNQSALFGSLAEVFSWQPDFSPSKLAGSYGTMKARVTGIKST